MDKDKYLYVADTKNNRIQKLDENGRAVFNVGRAGSGEAEFHLPAGIAVDDKYVYVSDTGNNRIQIFDRAGNYLTQFGSPGAGQSEFNSPMGLTIGKPGQLVIADTGNHRIQEFKVNF